MNLYRKKGNPMIKRVYTLVYNDDIFGFCGRPYYKPLAPIYKGRIDWHRGVNLPKRKWGKIIDTRKERLPVPVNEFITNIVYARYHYILGGNKIE